MGATNEQARPHASKSWLRLLGPRWPAAMLTLLVENLAIGVRVDASALRGRSVYGFEHLGTFATVFVVMVVATALLRGRRLASDLLEAQVTTVNRATWILLLVHAAAYATLWQLSVLIFDSPPESQIPVQLLGGWAAAALTVVASIALLLVHVSHLPRLLKRLSPSLGVGVLSGGLAVGLGTAATALWKEIGHYTLDASAWVLGLATRDVVYDADEMLLGSGDFVVHLAPICSGFEGMGLIAALLGGYIALHRDELRFPNVLVMVPLSILIVWLANAARIAALILIGAHWSPAVAVGGFHSQAGWVLFCTVALLMVLAIQNSSTFSKGVRVEGEPTNPATPYLLPLLVLIAVSMLTRLAAADVDLLYGVRIVAGAAILYLFRSSYRSMLQAPSFPSVLIGVAVYAMWIGLVPTTTDEGGNLRKLVLSTGAIAGPAWMFMRALGSALIVPIVEELAFRGYLLRRLFSPAFESVDASALRVLPVLTSSVCFGLLHGAWLAGTLAGMAYALAFMRRGQMIDAVVAHATTNSLIAAEVLLFGHWGLWS